MSDTREASEATVIEFGALAPPLCVQLGISKKAATAWQRDADAICRLKYRGLLADSEVKKVEIRLMKDMGFAGARRTL